jgi:glycosyltransferase involved in cell wall biosynthesis
VAFVLAPNHGLGAAWVKHLPVTCPVIASFSDLPWHRGRLRTWIKRYWARRVIRRACKVITVTHQTQQLVGGWAGPQHAGKVVLTGLPFRPEDLAGGSPPPKALELSLRVRQLIVCVTRVSPSKQLDVLFKAMERHLTVHPDAGFVIAGFDDSAESRRLQDLIEGSPVAARCVILPLIGIAEIGGLFRIASCSVWSLVSIGIYHSIHCGCPVLVRAGQDAQHLLENPAAGGWFSNLETMDEVLQDFLDPPRDRTETSAVVERFHARNVLEPLLAAAQSVNR